MSYVLTISYENQPGKSFDEGYFLNKHIPLVEQHFKPYGLISISVERYEEDLRGNKARCIAATRMQFESREALLKCMSKAGKTVSADVANYTNITPDLLISRIAI